MRVPRARLTVLGMMIAVAIVAAVFGVIRRTNYCLSRAAFHARWDESRREDERQSARHTLVIAANLAQADAEEHARWRSMYQKLAWRPWEPLPDDPFLKEPLPD